MIIAYIKKNRSLIFFLFCFVFGLSLYANSVYFVTDPGLYKYYPPFIDGVNIRDNLHLGAENYFIAEAIVAGKGFSNPFQVETGPTAWMPPLYPFLQALLLFILKSKFLVGAIIIFLKNIALILTGIIVFEISKKTSGRLSPHWALLLYILLITINFRWYFQMTHDSWLLLSIMCFIYPFAVFINSHHINLRTAIAWGVLGGISILASPILGLVWLTTCLTSLFSNKNLKLLTLSMTLFFIICSPWVIRNHVVFNKIIFIKSNLFHDLYYFNYKTDDGLVHEEFELLCLAWTAKNRPDCLYRKLGEVKFINKYKEYFFESFNRDPLRFFKNVKNRAISALFMLYPHGRYETFSIWKSILHFSSFLAIPVILLLRQRRKSAYMDIAMLTIIVYLAPYIAVSYYIRYSIPLLPVKVLLTFWGLDLICQLSKQKKQTYLP